jgi:Family of unknown function (DUF5856)
MENTKKHIRHRIGNTKRNKTKSRKYRKTAKYVSFSDERKYLTMKGHKNVTYKHHKTDNKEKSKIVRFFLEILNTIKIYHWKTKKYAEHKATDELYEKLGDHIDRFIEILMGKDGSRINILEKNIEIFDANSSSDFKDKIYEYRDFFINMDKYFHAKSDSDLLSIRDEILGDINQFLYLLTLH